MPGMQEIMADSFSNEAPGASQLAAAPAPVLAVPLLDDPNDDFCRVCGFGVSIMQLHSSTCVFAVRSFSSIFSNQYQMQICLLRRGTCCVVKLALRLFTKSALDLGLLQKGTGGVPCACVLSVDKPISRCRLYLPPPSE